MTNNQRTDAVGDDPANHLETAAALAVAALRRGGIGRDWLDELLRFPGDVLRSDQAAYVWDVSDDTIRRRAEAAAFTDTPIGYLMAGAVWLVSLRRLLDAIEREGGRPARLAAQTRANKIGVLRFQPQTSAAFAVVTAS
jgi:hypothetical protein